MHWIFWPEKWSRCRGICGVCPALAKFILRKWVYVKWHCCKPTLSGAVVRVCWRSVALLYADAQWRCCILTLSGAAECWRSVALLYSDAQWRCWMLTLSGAVVFWRSVAHTNMTYMHGGTRSGKSVNMNKFYNERTAMLRIAQLLDGWSEKLKSVVVQLLRSEATAQIKKTFIFHDKFWPKSVY